MILLASETVNKVARDIDDIIIEIQDIWYRSIVNQGQIPMPVPTISVQPHARFFSLASSVPKTFNILRYSHLFS